MGSKVATKGLGFLYAVTLGGYLGKYKPVLLARARYYIYQFKDNIAQSQLALDEYKKGLQQMADQLNSPQPEYMSDVRFAFLY